MSSRLKLTYFKLGKVAQRNSTPTMDRNVPGKNDTNALGRTLGPNILRRLPMIAGSNKLKRNH